VIGPDASDHANAYVGLMALLLAVTSTLPLVLDSTSMMTTFVPKALDATSVMTTSAALPLPVTGSAFAAANTATASTPVSTAEVQVGATSSFALNAEVASSTNFATRLAPYMSTLEAHVTPPVTSTTSAVANMDTWRSLSSAAAILDPRSSSSTSAVANLGPWPSSPSYSSAVATTPSSDSETDYVPPHVVAGGFNYATIGGTSPMSLETSGCDNSYVPLPRGWDLVEWTLRDEIFDHLLRNYGFGTTAIVFANGGLMCGKNAHSIPSCPVGHTYTNTNYLAQQDSTYKVRTCPARILIRSATTTTTTSTTTKSFTTLTTTSYTMTGNVTEAPETTTDSGSLCRLGATAVMLVATALVERRCHG